MIIDLLTQDLTAVAPIIGVSVGDPRDKATWQIQFADAATDQQRTAAAAALAAFDVLAPIRAEVEQQINRDAEGVRQKYLTAGDGMAQVYREKLEQAEEVMATGEEAANALDEATRIATYPTLAASVGVEAATLWECAQIVLARYQQLGVPSYAIERTRLLAKKAVANAADEAAIAAAYEAIQWP